MRRLIPFLLVVLGAGVAVYGVALLSAAVAWIVAGLAAVAAGTLIDFEADL